MTIPWTCPILSVFSSSISLMLCGCFLQVGHDFCCLEAEQLQSHVGVSQEVTRFGALAISHEGRRKPQKTPLHKQWMVAGEDSSFGSAAALRCLRDSGDLSDAVFVSQHPCHSEAFWWCSCQVTYALEVGLHTCSCKSCQWTQSFSKLDFG